MEEMDRYFADRIARFGFTPEGVGWKNAEAQRLRFRVMLDVVLPRDRSRRVEIHHIGCGMAHMKDFLDEMGLPYIYSGSDALPRMLEIARTRHPETAFTPFNLLADPPADKKYDYVVMNGTFHYLASGVSWDEWRDAVREMMGKAWEMTKTGMAFNLMTDRVDWRDPNLFYVSPAEVIQWVRDLSRLFVLRHDYWPFEFTFFVYKEGAVD